MARRSLEEWLEEVNERRSEIEQAIGEAKFRRDRKPLNRELFHLERLAEWIQTRAGFGKE